MIRMSPTDILVLATLFIVVLLIVSLFVYLIAAPEAYRGGKE